MCVRENTGKQKTKGNEQNQIKKINRKKVEVILLVY